MKNAPERGIINSIKAPLLVLWIQTPNSLDFVSVSVSAQFIKQSLMRTEVGGKPAAASETCLLFPFLQYFLNQNRPPLLIMLSTRTYNVPLEMGGLTFSR